MNLLLIYNTLSGKRKINKEINYIENKSSQKYECDKYSPNDGELIRDYIKNLGKKYDIFVSIGGDGTLHSVVLGIMELDYNPIVAIIPFGTLNDMAKGFNINKNLDKNIELILNMSNIVDHKIYKINDTYMVYSFALGLCVEASFIKHKRFGTLSYYLSVLKHFIKGKNSHLKLYIDDQIIEKNIKTLIITDSYRIAGYKIKKTNHLRIYILKCLKILFPFKLWMLFLRSKTKYMFEADKIEIESSNKIFNIDGEKYLCEGNIKIGYFKSLKFITNRR